MPTKKNAIKKENVTIKVQPQELNLTDLKELLKKSKSKKRKQDNKGLIIGYIITLLGIISLMFSLIVNRVIDREYFPDSTIIFILGVSLFTLIFGFYIIIRETR